MRQHFIGVHLSFFHSLLHILHFTPSKFATFSKEQTGWLDLVHLPPQLQLLPEPLKLALTRRLSSIVGAYLGAVKSGTCSDGRLLAQEIKIRSPFPGHEYLTISGQIDRVDDRQGTIHVVDYKSGQRPWASLEEKVMALRLGFLLQPLLYPCLYQTQQGLSYSPSFSFIFLGTSPPQEIMIPVPEGSEEILPSLESLMESGSFFPTSTELMRKWGLKTAKSCLYCDFISVCRRFDRNQITLNELYFKAFAQERFETITGQVAVGKKDGA